MTYQNNTRTFEYKSLIDKVARHSNFYNQQNTTQFREVHHFKVEKRILKMKTDFIFDRSTIAVSLTFTSSIIVGINVVKER